MSIKAATILDSLTIVSDERAARLATAGLAPKVTALKTFQQRRFSRTYSDLLSSPRYGPAARFFLDEIYGPADFTRRDAQFARVVPALVRLFPRDIVTTVATLAELHALSEQLDTAMGNKLARPEIGAGNYVSAWQETGRPADRSRQIDLTLGVADQLDRLTRKSVLRNSLRLMRGPAQAAGLNDLQNFLERGFDTFRSMGGAQEFIQTVAQRERQLIETLFALDPADVIPEHAARALQDLPS